MTQSNGKFSFLCPAMWTSLLGNRCELRLPKQLGLIFQFLGNAIATPHATMGLIVMITLLELQMSSTSIPEIILTMWNERLTAANAMIIQDGEGFLIVKPSTLINSKTLVMHHQILHEHHDSTWVFVWPDNSQSVIQCQGPMSADQTFVALGFPENVISLWILMGIDNPETFQGSKLITLKKATFGFCFVPELLRDPSPPRTEIEPTQEWTQLPQSLDEPKACIKCILPDNTSRVVICEADQTINQICSGLDLCPSTLTVTAAFEDPLKGEPFVVPKHKQVGEVAGCTLVLSRCIRSCKRPIDQVQEEQQ